jgi:predicted dehydrogenase
MKFALLGADSDLIALARAIARHDQHALVWIAEARSSARALHELAPAATVTDDWESLLSSEVADLVLVARPDPARPEDEDRRADQLRKLVQGAVPIAVSHPAQHSMIVCYEVEMIRHDTRSLVFPLLAWRWHPAVERLASLVRSGGDATLGDWEQIVIERNLADRGAANVRVEFARDVDLARVLAGDLTRLAALSPESSAGQLANLGVQLSGPEGILVRWSVRPVETAAGARLTVIGSQGRAVLNMTRDAEPWTLELHGSPDAVRTERFDAWDAGRESLRRIERAFAAAQAREEVSPAWSEAARAVELTETIDRSLARARTIELYQEEYSEEATFKGKMAALGCLLLMLAFAVVVLATIAAGLKLPIAHIWPVALAVVLGGFLLLQFFQLAFPRRER